MRELSHKCEIIGNIYIYVIEKTIFDGSQRDKECVSQKSPDLAALCKAAFDCD